MIGTGLEYYDSSLYWFLSPILAPLFFPEADPILGIIMMYAIEPIGLMARPLGAAVIGRWGDRFGRRQALMISITGTAVVTGLMGCVPTFAQVGVLAPVMLLTLRIVQKFFVAGEYNGGAIFMLEHSRRGKGYKSGLYCAFTVSGIFMASAVSAGIAYMPEGSWRWAYLLAFLTGLFGFYLRKRVPESPEFEEESKWENSWSLWRKVKHYRRAILCSIGAAAFFSTLYQLLSVFLNAFVPMITDITTAQMLSINTMALAVYLFALPLFGAIGDRLGFSRSMKLAATTTAVIAYPMFLLIEGGSLVTVCMIKMTFAIACAWYVSPFHAWIQELYGTGSRYQLISMSYSVGSQIGSTVLVMSLWLWKVTEFNQAPALVLIAWAIVGLLSLRFAKGKAVA